MGSATLEGCEMLRLQACDRGWTAIEVFAMRMVVVAGPLGLGAGKWGGATGVSKPQRPQQQ